MSILHNDGLGEAVIVPPGIPGKRCTDSDCILHQVWNRASYGTLKWKDKRVTAHRLALEFKLGRPIKPGLCACHTCDETRCINPEHLWEGSVQENTLDALHKRRLPQAGNEAFREAGKQSGFQKGQEPLYRFPKGKENPSCKLTEEDKEDIRLMAATKTHTEIAMLFGVHQSTISRILKKHLEEV